MFKVDNIKQNNDKQQRISTHSHIKGLGLNAEGNVSNDSCGLIGQHQARKVCRFLVFVLIDKIIDFFD